MSKIYAICLLVSILAISALAKDDIFLGENHEAGFIDLETGGDLFYWLFKSRTNPSEDPLVFWLTGGPGCASEVALFAENGPFTIDPETLQLKVNQYSWNNNSNIIFIDQPRGTGFSKMKDFYVLTEGQIARDFYDFLVKFIAKNPEYKGRDLFITGESYAGHYIPKISSYIAKQKNPDINLVASAIGNGWVDPYHQYPQYAEFSYENGLINKAAYELLKGTYKLCQVLVKSRVWPLALYACQLPTTGILGLPVAPRFNVYDIRKKCDHPPLCYDFSPIKKFLNIPEVREFLGVGTRSWTECNMVVHTFLLGDWMTNLANDVKYLLENDVNVLVYSGDKDFICNWRGGESWTHHLDWALGEQFRNTSYSNWTVGENNFGQFKSAGPLTFLRVYDAGHMVPMDQPEASLAMLNRFFKKWALLKKINKSKTTEINA